MVRTMISSCSTAGGLAAQTSGVQFSSKEAEYYSCLVWRAGGDSSPALFLRTGLHHQLRQTLGSCEAGHQVSLGPGWSAQCWLLWSNSVAQQGDSTYGIVSIKTAGVLCSEDFIWPSWWRCGHSPLDNAPIGRSVSKLILTRVLGRDAGARWALCICPEYLCSGTLVRLFFS